MKLLLDTHAWIWTEEDPSQLGSKTKQLIVDRKNELMLSPISTLEISQLAFKGRLQLLANLPQWVENSCRNLSATTCELTHGIAAHAYSLPGGFHADPADRILVASARMGKATLVTADERILSYPNVKSVDARR